MPEEADLMFFKFLSSFPNAGRIGRRLIFAVRIRVPQHQIKTVIFKFIGPSRLMLSCSPESPVPLVTFLGCVSGENAFFGLFLLVETH